MESVPIFHPVEAESHLFRFDPHSPADREDHVKGAAFFECLPSTSRTAPLRPLLSGRHKPFASVARNAVFRNLIHPSGSR